MGMLRFDAAAPRRTSTPGSAPPYRTWLEVLGSDGAPDGAQPVPPGPLETLELERNGAVERIEVAGSPEIFVREVEDFEAARARRRAAGRQPRRKPPHGRDARRAARLGAERRRALGPERAGASSTALYPQ